MKLISVIVPVYKVEKYLDKCISSIVNQTYKNLEIILVDDGSQDRSGEICDTWAAKDSRIIVIHQSNAGGGPARNAALDVAKGEFIGMIDSDDYIEPHMYEHLYGLMTSEIDIAECCIKKVRNDDAVLDDGSIYRTQIYDTEEAMNLHIRNQLFLQTPPNKLYRRVVVEGVRFPAGTGIDDEYWTYRTIGNARKLVHSSCIMYAYRQQEESVMHNLNSLQRLRAVEAKMQRHAYIQEQFPNLARESAKNLWFTCLYQGQLIMHQEDQKEKLRVIAYLKEILRTCSVKMNGCTLKEKIWLLITKVSFVGACCIRNLLKIGL